MSLGCTCLQTNLVNKHPLFSAKFGATVTTLVTFLVE